MNSQVAYKKDKAEVIHPTLIDTFKGLLDCDTMLSIAKSKSF